MDIFNWPLLLLLSFSPLSMVLSFLYGASSSPRSPRTLCVSSATGLHDTSVASQIDRVTSFLQQVGRPYADKGAWEKDIRELRDLLELTRYHHSAIKKHIFNLPIHEDDDDLSIHLQHDESLETYKNDYPFGPTYVQPLSPGQSIDLRQLIDFNSTTESTSLPVLTTLFLLSSCVPLSLFKQAVLGGEDTLNLFLRLGIVCLSTMDDDKSNDEQCVVPLVHFFPMQIPQLPGTRDTNFFDRRPVKSMILMTDLHPNVLSKTTIPSESDEPEEGAVMYIGPDSLALVQHLHAHFGDFMNSKIDRHGVFRILDLCCGSGVQALATLGMLDLLRKSGHESANEVVKIEAVAVDINQRALRFTEFNTRLNGFGFCSKMDGSTMCDQEMKVTIVRSDLLADDTTPFIEKMIGKSVSDYLETGVNRKFDILLANPPFIPVPNMVTDHTTLSLRESKPIAYNSQSYGLFSVGGVGGEDCLLAVIQMSPHLLRRDGGLMGIVSEFMNPPLNYVDKQKCLLLTKIEKWFGTHDVAARGVLFTNEHPLTRQVYAKRRALTDDKDTISLWLRHLENHHINHVSPGLLFVKSQSDGNEPNTGCQLEYSLVPKSRLGSVWTPQNVNAVEHTMKVLNKLFHSPPQLDNYP